jgi:glycosyltransferase involved in cell wall biosynthesis
MKLAYLLNAYPMTSTTFIRREIEAHERHGVPVDRFAIRPWDQDLVDPHDIAEKARVFYLLGGGLLPLVAAFLRESLGNPKGVARALRATGHLIRRASGNRLRTIVYFLEAVHLKQQAVARGITHMHTHFSTNSAAVAMLSQLMGGPGYSITIHGPDELYDMARNALTLKVHHARFVAVISAYCREVVDAHTARRYGDKIHIVRCGLDMAEFTGISDVPDSRELVCVGRLCKAKAQPLLVEAVAEVVLEHPDLKLILIGDGEERGEVERRIAALDLSRNVELAGWKSNSDVRAALSRSRALVLPSLAEGLPIVIMESLALGRPVVSTRITGIPELVDADCGWLAEPGDRATLVEALKAVLSQPPQVLSRMGRTGRARVAALHDQDRNAAVLRDLIAAAAQVGSARPS